MEQIVYALIGGGVFGAIVSGAVTIWTTRHGASGEQRGWFDQLQEERTTAVKERDEIKAQLKACEEQARQERMRWDVERREMQAAHDRQQTQIGALAFQLDEAVAWAWALKTGVENGTVPPIIPAPYTLRSILHTAGSDAPVVRVDNGVPGTEATNPPPTDAMPDPPDDGQDKDPTTTEEPS